MVKTLKEGGAAAKRKIVIAGEMRELGNDSANIHFETGKRIAEIGVDKLVGVEGFAENLIEGAKTINNLETEFFENSDVAGENFINQLQTGDLVLIKGSRGVRTEKVIEKILEKFELEKQ